MYADPKARSRVATFEISGELAEPDRIDVFQVATPFLIRIVARPFALGVIVTLLPLCSLKDDQASYTRMFESGALESEDIGCSIWYAERLTRPRELDAARLRLCLWKKWKRVHARLRELRALSLPEWVCLEFAFSRKRYWRMSAGPLNRAVARAYWNE